MASSSEAWRDGVRRVNSAPMVLLGMYALTLLVALPLSLALRSLIAAHLGDSLFADALASGANYDWWQEFSAQASGLGTTFVPSIVGFGAVLNNLSALLDNVEMATTIAGATTAWLVLWSFLSGGVLDRYARMRPTRATGFFAACGTHFWRFLRLGVLALLVYWVLFALVHPWLFDDLYPWVTRDMTAERSAFAVRLLCYLVFLARLDRSRTWSSTTRASASSSRIDAAPSAPSSLARASCAGIPRRCGSICSTARASSLLALAYALVAPGAPSGLAIWIALVVGQIYILLRHYVKLLFYASQVSFFQSRLAHAAYTAAPPVVWPDSPAAESIGNA